MKPEFPPWFDLNADFDGVSGRDDGGSVPCGMLCMGSECGNAAYTILSYQHPHKPPVFLAICEECATTWAMTGEATTAYWRKKQREWGVR